MSARVPARSSLPLILALGFLVIALTGFSTTFFLPVARGRFTAPSIVYLHAALFFGWLFLLIGQAQLVRARHVALHRRVGWLGALWAVAMVISGVGAGIYAAHRDVADGGGDAAWGTFVVIVLEMILFGALVAGAVLLRRDRASHQRLLFLATISMLGPAWFRFRHIFPSVDHPLVVFSLIADAVIIVPVVHDLLVSRRVHPVYVWAGGMMIAVHIAELAAGESALFVRTARFLLGETG